MLYMALAMFIVLATFMYNYRFEVMENISDTFGNNPLAAKRRMGTEVVFTDGKYTLRPERNDIGFVRVADLRVGRQSTTGIPVTFTLINEGDSNDFPSVRLIMQNHHGAQTRQIIFGSRDYMHADQFENQPIELLVTPRVGEITFTVQPFYPEKS